MNLEELRSAVGTGEIDTVLVATSDMQGRLVGKRLTARHFLQAGIDGIGTCSVVLGWGHDHSLDPGYELTGWSNGYPDLVVKAETSRIYRLGWCDRTVLVVADGVDLDGALVPVAPRSILKSLLAQCAERGLRPFFASELECYLLAESPLSVFDKGFVNLRTKHRTMHPETLMRTSEDEDFFGPVRRHMEAAGIEMEMVKAEYAPGQVEFNLAYAEALEAADRHMVFKAGVKEIALKLGLIATFMAKLSHDLGGSSCHVHMSLVDGHKNNVLAAGQDGKGTSEIMRHLVGGMTTFARDFFLLYAPTVNSYRRLRPGTFAPATVTWGEDNRTVAFRLVGKNSSRRIENRIPGADINPYLVYAAMLASGLEGLARKLEPVGQQAAGNAYERTDAPALPLTLHEATQAFAASPVVEKYFGKGVQDHYTNFGMQSVNAAASRVTDYERQMLLLDI